MRDWLRKTKLITHRIGARLDRELSKLIRQFSRSRLAQATKPAYDRLLLLLLPLGRRFDEMWRLYLGWRWQKTVSRGLGVFAAITLSLMTYSAFAATSTATLVPNNNATSGWTSSSGANYTTVDDGTSDNTSDYVQVLASNSTATVTDTYGLTTANSVASASQITLRIYMKASTASNGGAMDTISLNLLVNGTPQTAATCTPVNGTWSACTKTFTGSWTQADVDSMQVQIVRNIMGSGNPSNQPDTVQVANVYGTLTYTPSIQFNQSAYRWFNNQDADPASAVFKGLQTKVDFTTGGNPYSLTTADFNDDGKKDMVSADANDSTVSVFLGNGNGTLGARTTYASGSIPYAVTNADVNGDGKADLVTANNSANTISILLGNGDGTFQAKTDYATGSSPYDVVAADFNGDGHVDVATPNMLGKSVSVLLGNGDGTFQAKTDYSLTSNPYGITAADVNADSKTDLIVADAGSNTVSVLLGNGDGTFQAKVSYPTGALAYNVAAADVNGDGKVDLAVPNYSDNTVSILLGNGDGTFQAKVDYPTGTQPQSVAIADFNGDNKPDLAVGDEGSDSLSLLLGNGDGTFQAKTDYTAGNAPWDVAVADFNGDNRLDLATPNELDSTASVFINLGANTPMDVSTPMAAQDTAATAPDEGTIFRLRLDIHVSSGQANANVMNLKLQYADKGAAASCSAVATGNFSDIGDSSTGIRWADNTNAINGSSLISNANDPVHGTDTNVSQSYQEKGTTTFGNPNAIPINEDGMWDFGLVAYHSMQNTTYCFRVVKSDGSLLSGYTQYPELNMPAARFTQASYRWYNPEPSGSAATFIKDYGKTNDGTYDYSEVARDVITTSDGGYATAGDVNISNGTANYDALLTKYDGSGGVQWTERWGGSAADNAYALIQTSDGGYAMTGSTKSFGAGGTDMFLAKYDSNGNLLWSKTWGDANNSVGNSLVEDSSGNILVVGQSNSYIFLAKYSAAGSLLSAETTSGYDTGEAVSISPTADGGYLIGANTSDSNSTLYMEIIKTDSTGAISWSKTLTGSQLGGIEASSAVELNDGSIAVVGDSLDGYGAEVAKYDANGNYLWSHSWGGNGSNYFDDVAATSDNGFITVGITSTYGQGSDDLVAVKYNSDGTISWSKTWGSTGKDAGEAMAMTPDGGFVAAGYTQYGGSDTNQLLLKYDSSGSISGCNSPSCQSVNWTGSDEGTNQGSGATAWSASAIADNKLGYSVGDTGPAGGIIFYVDSSNTYSGFDYLEAAPTDQGTSAWGCSGTIAGATWSGLGNGDQNTATIVGACSGSTAAKMSDGLTSGGYSDWYLPDLEEVNMMISNISPSLSAGAYWSSSEDTYIDVPSRTGNYAYASSGDILKTTVLNVRSTRKFTGIQPGLGSYAMTTTIIVGSGVSVGNPLAPQNRPLDLPELTPLTLRLAVRTDGSGVSKSGQSFKLQYAVKTSEATCNAVASTNYQDITSSSELAYYDDSRHASGEAIVDNPNDPSDGSRTMVAQAYEEANPFSNSVAPLYAGQDGMWQFSLVINNSTLKGRDFCIRIALAGDTYPSISALNVADVAYAPQMEQLMRGGEWFSRSTGSKQHLTL